MGKGLETTGPEGRDQAMHTSSGHRVGPEAGPGVGGVFCSA